MADTNETTEARSRAMVATAHVELPWKEDAMHPPARGAGRNSQVAEQTHELKCVPPFFAAVLDGSKPFEVRKHDRPFAEGDTLLLREFWNGTYTGREIKRRITYVLCGGEFGIEWGYCVLGLAAPDFAVARAPEEAEGA